MKKNVIAKSIFVFGFLFSGVVSYGASIVYQFTGNDANGLISFQYTSQDFIAGPITISAQALDFCTTHLGAGPCVQIGFYPQNTFKNPVVSTLTFASQIAPNVFNEPPYDFPVGTFNSIGIFQSIGYNDPGNGIFGTLVISTSPEPSTAFLGLIGLIAIGVRIFLRREVVTAKIFV